MAMMQEDLQQQQQQQHGTQGRRFFSCDTQKANSRASLLVANRENNQTKDLCTDEDWTHTHAHRFKPLAVLCIFLYNPAGHQSR